jgi:hypothetical protein
MVSALPGTSGIAAIQSGLGEKEELRMQNEEKDLRDRMNDPAVCIVRRFASRTTEAQDGRNPFLNLSFYLLPWTCGQ